MQEINTQIHTLSGLTGIKGSNDLEELCTNGILIRTDFEHMKCTELAQDRFQMAGFCEHGGDTYVKTRHFFTS
jgi:hypothetical protein